MEKMKFQCMDYCQETVIIQSAFLLAEKMVNLEHSLQKDEFYAALEVIKEAVNEISEGVSIDKIKNTLLPIEIYALHRKIHLWLYKTWTNCCSYDSDDACFLERFPALPRFGTGLYILIVKEMGWELFLAECSIKTEEDASPLVLQDIVSTTVCFQEIGFFTLLFDCLLPTFASRSHCLAKANTSTQVLLDGLTSLAELITLEKQQLLMMKRIIDFVFQEYQFLITTCSENQIELGRKEVGEGCESDGDNITMHEKGTHLADGDDTGVTSWSPDFSNIWYCLEALMKLITDQWKDTCNWKTCKDNKGQMDSGSWHPLHQWILKMYAVLGYIVNTSILNTSQDSKLSSFYHGLTAYIKANATTSEMEWMETRQEGAVIDSTECLDSLEDEHIDVSGIVKTFLFTHGSIKEQLDDAIWRINNHLEGALDSLNWLLTTEELFDNPLWLQCVKDNVVKMGHKKHAMMLVDVLCVQRQIIESTPECTDNGFSTIKELVTDMYDDLPRLDQEELLKYTFSMSLLSDLDVTSDSVLFHPTQVEEDKKKLQDELQVLFNKLVDSSSVSAFKRQVRDIKQLAFSSPYCTLFKAVSVGVQYGQTTTILKILQEIPVLCSLCSSNTAAPLLCDILVSITRRLPNKQEENNLMKLVQVLLQRYQSDNFPDTSQTLLDKSNLLIICILPYMSLQGNEKPIPTRIALKLLKTTISAIDSKNQTEKPFVLRYLIPIVLALCRLLYDCKALWEDMGSDKMTLLDVVELRSLVLINLEESVDVIHNMFQSTPTGLLHPLGWLNNKLLSLGWTAALYIQPLLDILATSHQYSVPTCIIEFCGLPSEHWCPCSSEESDYSIVSCLFECCAISDTILSQIRDALEKKSWSSMDASLKGQVTRSLSQVMAYMTWPEMTRIVCLCMTLIHKAHFSLEHASLRHVTSLASRTDLPANLTGMLVMSDILHQVFQLVLNTNTVISNVIKLYVSTIKQMCQEFLADPSLDKCLSGDVIAHVFDDLCHVICMVPLADTDPLFILALDVASLGQAYDEHLDVCRHAIKSAPSKAFIDRYRFVMWLSPLDGQQPQNFSDADFVQVLTTTFADLLPKQVEVQSIREDDRATSVVFDIHARQTNNGKQMNNSSNRMPLDVLFDFKTNFKMEVAQRPWLVVKVTSRILSCVDHQVYPPGKYKYFHHNQTLIVNSTDGQQEAFPFKQFFLVYNQNESLANATAYVCRSFFRLQCSHVMLAVKDEEYVMFANKTLLFKPTGQQYAEGDYDMIKDVPWVCTNYSAVKFTNNKTNETLVKTRLLPVSIHTDIRRYMTIIGFSISILCLFLVLLAHGILRDLRDPLPGKNLISLSVSLFLAHFWYLLGSGDTDKPLFCYITACLLHYLFLASFGCTFIVAYDTRRTFSAKTAKAHAVGASHQARRLAVYLLISWGLPLVLVVTCAVLDWLDVVAIGYRNENACWIGNATALLVVFAAPIGLVLVYNVLAFTQTIYAINSARKQTERVKSSHYARPATVKIYIRLISLMGFSWFFGISAPLIHHGLMYAFVFFTTLQGLYIFLAFVCKARVLRMLKAKLPLSKGQHVRHPTKGANTTTSSLTSTPYSKYPAPKDETEM